MNSRIIKLYLIILFTIDLFGCHQANNGTAFVIAKPGVYADSVKNIDQAFMGDWSNLRDTNLVFTVDKDSIFYMVAHAGYRYKLKHDSITITFDDDIYHARLKLLSKDTLVMIGTGKDKGNIDSVYRNDSPDDK